MVPRASHFGSSPWPAMQIRGSELSGGDSGSDPGSDSGCTISLAHPFLQVHHVNGLWRGWACRGTFLGLELIVERLGF